MSTSTAPVSRLEVPRRWVGHGGGFWVIAAAFAVSVAFSTLPTPLYGLYEQRDGFGPTMITVVFVAYAVGVIASLYFVGHISDWVGRRRMIIAATLTEALAAVLFLTWPEVPGLLLARLVSGVGIGALTATATAHLSELRLISRPREDQGRSSLISTMVNCGGFSIGPLVGGVLVSYARAPLTTPYLIFLALLLVSAIAVALVPETVARPEVLPAYHPQRVSLPSTARPTFYGAAAGAFAAFAINGLVLALVPTLLLRNLHQSSALLAGVVAFAVVAVGVLAQFAFSTMGTRGQLRIGLTAMVVGLVTLPVSVLTVHLWLFLFGGIVAGSGVGLIFRASVATAAGLAQPPYRGEVLAALFLAAYAGLVIPVLAVGIALTWVPSSVALLAFSVLELVLVCWSGHRTLSALRS
jgi:Major Facilitator Superfamily